MAAGVKVIRLKERHRSTFTLNISKMACVYRLKTLATTLGQLFVKIKLLMTHVDCTDKKPASVEVRRLKERHYIFSKMANAYWLKTLCQLIVNCLSK